MSHEHDVCVDCSGIVEPGTCHVGLPDEPSCVALRLTYDDLGHGRRNWNPPEEVAIKRRPA